MNAKGYLGFALAMAMMSETNFDKGNEPREFIPPKQVKKIIPKGCKEFKFTYGNNEFYECIATSQKSADRKFKGFLKRNVGF
jgi:hypothetical protein